MSAQPYWLAPQQDYAVDQLRQQHVEALYSAGEWAMFVLLWRAEDEEAGLVGRCPHCYLSQGEIAESYGQAAKKNCPECYGTTFAGGYKAKIVRPAIWDLTGNDNVEARRGEVDASSATIQSTPDFVMRRGDWVLRGDGGRWQVSPPTPGWLTTGFGLTTDVASSIGFNYAQANLEAPTAAAYLVPPTVAEQRALLAVRGHTPPDWSAVEEIRGSLL